MWLCVAFSQSSFHLSLNSFCYADPCCHGDRQWTLMIIMDQLVKKNVSNTICTFILPVDKSLSSHGNKTTEVLGCICLAANVTAWPGTDEMKWGWEKKRGRGVDWDETFGKSERRRWQSAKKKGVRKRTTRGKSGLHNMLGGHEEEKWDKHWSIDQSMMRKGTYWFWIWGLLATTSFELPGRLKYYTENKNLSGRQNYLINRF